MTTDPSAPETARADLYISEGHFNVPVAVAEEVQDIALGLEDLDGSYWYTLGSDNLSTRVWINRATQIRIDYPAGYETPDERENYVQKILDIRARFRLGLGPTDDDA